ncbi:sensor histidine kinase [Pedobacter changchengzhani]|uniref:histidine kinase n=1 Tax=Pedobacter changchengzhani TaxID=2529274 RepID=A0A4R5MJY8_9SPHI|nr:GAF domain-containing sensor histidine kinase [Pedobacter changchengzhani]TDG35858.1 sensor histidine kinase [Pedobacter changchengzhani]
MIDSSQKSNNEENFLDKLASFEILDSEPEIEFDLITAIVSQIFNAPIALISFFDGDRVFVKSAVGYTPKAEITFQGSLFSLSTAPLKIEDTLEDELTKHKKFYINDEQIDCYISAPLITEDGFTIGNICAINTKPKNVSDSQLSILAKLAKLVMEKLNNRVFLRNWIKISDERVHMLIHDLKNPMTTLCLHSELIGKFASNQEKVISMSAKMNKQSKAVVSSMNEILSSSRTENGIVKMQKIKLDLRDVLENVKRNLESKLKQQSQSLILSSQNEIYVYGDEYRLSLAFEHLIENAIKFSKKGGKIRLITNEDEDYVTVSIIDEGVGIIKEELDSLFTKFARLSAIGSGYQKSNGLGLSIAKMLIDLHKGKIWAESSGRNLGSTFYVALPKR